MAIKRFSLFLFIMVFYFMLTAFGRNIVWSHDIYLWGDTSSKSPYSIRASNAYATSLLKGGFADKAVAELESVLVLSPRAIKTRLNLGAALFAVGDFKMAEQQFLFVLNSFPQNIKANFNLAILYMAAYEKPLMAEKILSSVVKRGKMGAYEPKIYMALSDIYKSLGNNEKSSEYEALLSNFKGVKRVDYANLLKEVY